MDAVGRVLGDELSRRIASRLGNTWPEAFRVVGQQRLAAGAADFDQLTRAIRALRGQVGFAELAVRADSTVERVLEARQLATARRSVSLDAPLGGDESGEFAIDVGVEEAGFGVAEDAELLGGLLATLPPRARAIVRLRFQEDLTQREIGAIVGISQMQVSRVLGESITQLRAAADV